MLCESCLKKSISKLLTEDILILEYLLKEGATLSQCTISRSIIKNNCRLSDYKCYTALDRLELFDMVSQHGRSKSNKYYITDIGKKVLLIIEQKMGVI